MVSDDKPLIVAKYQFLIHIQYLMDTTTGLWFHGWEFDGNGGGHNYAKALWGRGNCWVRRMKQVKGEAECRSRSPFRCSSVSFSSLRQTQFTAHSSRLSGVKSMDCFLSRTNSLACGIRC